jgi:hypothetical protein
MKYKHWAGLLAVVLVGMGGVAHATADDCRGTSPSGIDCEVTRSANVGGVYSFAVAMSGFAEAGDAVSLVVMPSSSSPLVIQVPPELNEGCVASATECDAVCGCEGESCTCSAWGDMVYCQWWIETPNGWDIWGEGEVC